MPTSSDRMKDNVEVIGRILWPEWVDLPADVMVRFPSMREYNRRMRLRDESARAKIDQELSRLQKEQT